MLGKPHPERGRLRERWEEVFGSPPPQYLSVGFMEAALSYEAQCREHGGLRPVTRRALRRIAQGEPVAEAARTSLRPGAHLAREWNGRTYQVEVHTDGYRMVAESGTPHPDAWRLPAEELERKVSGLIRSILTNTGFAARLDPGAPADAIGRRAEALNVLAGDNDQAMVLKLVDRIDIAPGSLRLRFDPETLASAIDVDPDNLDDEGLTHSFPFQLRKRGWRPG